MPKLPSTKPSASPDRHDQGIVRDERGQEQPRDKERAQRAAITTQRDAAESEPQSPGDPAGGE